MKKLRKEFESLYKKYVEKRPKFKKRIENLSGSEHDKGHELLEIAERHIDQMKILLDQDNANIDQKEFATKVNEFKKLFKDLNHYIRPAWVEWLEAWALAIVVVLVLRNFVFGLYHVPSGSAEPNLLVGDRVIGSKMAYMWGDKPKRGDLVMFDSPHFQYDEENTINYYWQKYVGIVIPFLGLGDGPDNLVKRVIAIPGDTIEGRVENGKTAIYLNGKHLDEPYVNKYPLIAMERRTGFIDLDTIGPIRVPSVLKKKLKYPVFYTYVPKLDYSQQPYYYMSSEDVGLEPRTLRPWTKKPGVPGENEYGRVIDVFGPLKLPKGKYWVMGDSRRNSTDSRVWGLLDENLIHGRASMVLYSIDSEEPWWFFELLKSPVGFWVKHIRWNRFFKKLWLDENQKPGKLENN